MNAPEDSKSVFLADGSVAAADSGDLASHGAACRVRDLGTRIAQDVAALPEDEAARHAAVDLAIHDNDGKLM